MGAVPKYRCCPDGRIQRGLDRGTGYSRWARPPVILAAALVSLSLASHAFAGSNDFPPGDPIAALGEYVRTINAAPNPPASAGVWGDLDPNPHAGLSPLAGTLGGDPPSSTKAWPKLAEADNAFDALREFLQRRENLGAPAPPLATPVPRPPIKAPAPEPIAAGPPVGSGVCLGCHTPQAEAFSHTMMGRLVSQGKLQCETCHGPGSAHVQAVGCAACHGDGGISHRPGIPNLVGQDPQYLLTAMKAYISGQRKNALMQALLSRLGTAELDDIALYYAHQTPERAQTPPVGDAASGRAAIAVCANCHGANGESISPAWPNLAGQDAQYLADAIRAYKHGARSKVIACAACHGEQGISKTPGVPSLVGQSPQYLVAAMKAYGAGERKNGIMKALLAGTSDAELEAMAAYYAQQTPARAHTGPLGNVGAGKTAAAACAACHGEQGISANPAWPSLAGQDGQYLAEALRAYKSGARSDATMKGFAAALDEHAIEDIAGYFASLAPAQTAPGGGTASKREPVLVRNGLVAGLDDRTINNIASYYASLRPAAPNVGKYGPLKRVPAFVRTVAPVDGRSVGGIVSFRKDDPGRTAEQNNGICLTCHERGDRTYWHSSVHDTRGLACTDCHTVMRRVSATHQLKTPFEPDTCFQCHKDRRAQMFRSAHMPLREGKMVCSDCHNPHGSYTEAALRGDSVNAVCYKCHAEKRGPFLFEHAPVRENCLNCHDPHGAVNEYMLKVSRPRLCAECHGLGHASFLTQGPAQIGAFSRSCQNCHTEVHGTNSPSGALLHR